ncbi:MAG: GFA family protein [Pseudomonadota bacterium]
MTQPTILTGGCQCGAIRYRITQALHDPHICHCRMCQKAAGNYFMPLGGAKRENFELTRGTLSVFKSSGDISRGFCNQCGTPLTFELGDYPGVSITLGSLDDPAAVPPVSTYGVEARMPWIVEACARDGRTTEEEDYRDGERIGEVAATNRQHPDHDTAEWPPK